MSEASQSGPGSSPGGGGPSKELTGQIGKYEIVRALGKGAMGQVYLAFDTMLEREVALKVMVAAIADDPELKKRFEREAKAVAKMTHPNVVMVFDLGYHTDGSPYLAMELLKGNDLQQAMRKPPPLSVDRKVQVMTQVLAGLSHAHQAGIVHRDIKPANIFICEDGTVKIMDFGVARLTTASMTGTGNIVGTADYMSPEQVKGAKVDGRSDLFSVGCMLYEMVTGRRPFHSENLMAIFYKITHEEPNYDLVPSGPEHDALLPIIKKALSKDLDERYATAYEFAVALREYLRLHASSASGSHALEDLLDLEPPPTHMPPPIGSEDGGTEVSVATMDLRPGSSAGGGPGPTLVAGSQATVVGGAPAPTRIAGAPAAPTRFVPRPAAAPSKAPLFAGLAAVVVIGGAAAGWYFLQPPPAPPPTTMATVPTTIAPPPTAAPVTEPPPTTAPPPTVKPEGAGAAAMRRANDAFRRNDYDGAIANAQDALRADPGSNAAKNLVEKALSGQKAEARFAAARKAMAAGDFDAAESEAREGQGLAGWDSRGPELINQAREGRRLAEEAAQREAQAARAAQVNGLLGQADGAFGAQKLEEARALYEQVLQVEPNNQRAAIGRTNVMGAIAVRDIAKSAGPARPTGKTFVSGKTQKSSTQSRNTGNVPPGFEAAEEIKVEKGTAAVDLPGDIKFTVDPASPQSGSRFSVNISFSNDGAAPIRITSMVMTATVNGRKARNPVPPLVQEVAPHGTATIFVLQDNWRGDTTEWSLEVAVNTSTGDNYQNAVTWQ